VFRIKIIQTQLTHIRFLNEIPKRTLLKIFIFFVNEVIIFFTGLLEVGVFLISDTLAGCFELK
jgi:hypothetical protein